MANTLAQPYRTTPDKDLVTGKARMAKAQLRDNGEQEALSDVVIAAAKRSHGKQGAAAAHLGKDEGNFSRDVKAGRMTTEQMQRLGPDFLAEFGKQLVDRYGPLSDPKDRARRVLDTIESAVMELRQYVEDVA